MAVVAFVMLAGVMVGSIGLRAGTEAVVGVLFGALGAVLLDAAGLLWRARGTLPPEHRIPSPVPVLTHPGAGECGIPGRVLWLILRDTFEVSLVIIALVGGLTYAVLATFVWSLHLLAE
jgi:hypothetical protein